MTKKEFGMFMLGIFVVFVVIVIIASKRDNKDEEPKMTVQEEIAQNTLNNKIAAMQPLVNIDVKCSVSSVSDNEIEIELAYDELEYLAACVEAEAGTEGLIGKRLVVDVILNRIDSDKFPDTITEVINAPGQFSVVSNGAINKVDISQETFEAIEMELEHRTDSKIMYFRSGKYGTGTPAYKVNSHYFSY